jgi:hypothetical protein
MGSATAVKTTGIVLVAFFAAMAAGVLHVTMTSTGANATGRPAHTPRLDGPGGKTVFLTDASVTKLLRLFDGCDDRSLIANCWIKEAKQQWDLGHPPACSVDILLMYKPQKS